MTATTEAAETPTGAGPVHADDSDAPTRFEPVAEANRYAAPKATVDPDTDKGWVRRVMPIVMAHRWLLIGSLAAAFIALLSTVAVPAVVRSAIDDALIARESPISRFVVVLVILAAVRAVTAFGYRYGLYRLAYLIETDLRSIIYRHLTRLSFSFFDRVQAGQLISRANSDIRSVQMYLAFAPLMSMTLLTFGIAFAFMLTISVPLTIVGIAALPGVYMVGARLRDQIFPLTWIVQSRLADVATIVDENINGVRVIKSFAAEEEQIGLLAHAARRLQWATVAMANARARYGPLMENLPRLGMVAVLVYGGWLVIEGEIQLGTLVAFNAYIVMLQAPFRLLGFFLMLGQRANASAQRIYEILDEQPEIADRPEALHLVDPEGRIELRDVTFGYADGPDVLSGFGLTIEPGETVAIVGRTGSGKSTIARLLPRFYDVRSGSVLVDGTDVRDLTLASLRANVGLVLDEPFLFSTSVRDNIAYGRPDAAFEEIVAAATAAQAHEFIEKLPDAYDTVVGERGYTLSGGQRQRLALARTLLVNPRLLVLDDATSAVDVGVEAAIHTALEGRLEGRTTIVIAHRLSTISLADRVVLLEDGRVAASGTHAELMEHEPRYADVLARSREIEERLEEEQGEEAADEDDVAYRRRVSASVSRTPDLGFGGLGGLGGIPSGGGG